MPLAAPIPVTASSAAPELFIKSGQHGNATSTQEFGALFREKASAIEAPKSTVGSATAAVAAPKTVSAVQFAAQVTVQAADHATLAPKAEAAESAELSQISMGPTGEVASDCAAQPGSSQAQVQAKESTQLQANTKSAANPPAETTEASLPAAVAESPGAPITQSKTRSLSSTPTAHSEHKTKEASQTGEQATERATLPAAAQPLVPASPSLATSAMPVTAQPTAVVSPPGKGSAQPNQNQPASNANSAQRAVPLVQEAQTDPVAAATSSAPANASDTSAHASIYAAGESGDSSKTSSESAAAALHPDLAHIGQATSSAIGSPADSAAPAEAHPVSAETAAASPHTEPPIVSAAVAVGPAASSAAPLAASPYDKIDQGASPVVLRAGAQHVTVGVRDPDLGWVEIRTQNTAGHVDATLAASSSQTHDTLAAQLPAMAQYLQERDVRVGTLAVQHPFPQASAGGGQNGSQNSGSNPNSGGGGSPQPFGQPGSGHRDSPARYPGVPPRVPRSSSHFGTVGVEDTASSLRSLSYISVRA